MLAFGLLFVFLLTSAASAVLIPCGQHGDCPINQHCCGPVIGCWPNGQSCPPSTGEGSCPAQKTVGGTCYVIYEVGVDTSQYGCTANCTYKKARLPGGHGDDDIFCFKQPGEFPVSQICTLDPEVEVAPRIRRNLASLNPTEINELKLALGAAKEPGTYSPTWPIKNGFFPNGQYFNSSFNAAVAFHGYPLLCQDSECCIHGYSTFLPWHRLFMVQIEDALRHTQYTNITIPYWDWTQNFKELPGLVADEDKGTNPFNGTNPFYHSEIPGKSKYTERSAQALIDYTNFECLENEHFCPNVSKKYPDISRLGDMVLTALEEDHYENFEMQIEFPHNQVHNQLGFLPNTTTCLETDHKCYPYTMQNLWYAAYDPIFLIFHTMVDYQWAIFQALQKYRCKGHPPGKCPFAYENDPHPSFTEELAPFNSDVYNRNEATKEHSTGQQVVNYTQSLGYEYENLQLFGRNIPELDKFLKERGNEDRLFAGFSLPNMFIQRITFNVCHPITNCTYSSPDFTISKIHGNQEIIPGVFKNKLLLYHDVTKTLAYFGLKPSQDIGFKIVSSSIPANVTFTHVSIYRKANTKRDRITIHWRKDPDYSYAPFFKTRPNATIRFLLENGSLSVLQYPDRESFQSCSNPTIVSQEVEIKETQTYFFQNPLRPDCLEKNKLQVSTSKPGDFSTLHKYANGSGTIRWVEDMISYKDGICMEPGTHLTFEWKEGNHNIARVADQDDFKHCKNFTKLHSPLECPGPDNQHPVRTMTYPPLNEEGFKLGEEYYIVCPCWGHCNRGMKLKINIKEKCPRNIN